MPGTTLVHLGTERLALLVRELGVDLGFMQ
jgi:hypothetical protein